LFAGPAWAQYSAYPGPGVPYYGASGRVTFVGTARVDRDSFGRVVRVGDKAVTYDSQGRCSGYGDGRIDYQP